jgi:uncharacterized Zn-binding protein involved in type VI secretion
MSLPAARVTDMHVCPMFNGPQPHVGGVIVTGNSPTVLIGGMPAAILGDSCACAGSMATIIKGSATVFIGGKPAARMGDMTSHGGTIMMGCPTVLIGDSAGGVGSGGGGAATSHSKVSTAQQTVNNSNAACLQKSAQQGDEDCEKITKEDCSAQYTIRNERGEGIAHIPYTIEMSDGQIFEGKTDGSGNTNTLTGYTVADGIVKFKNKNT